MKIENPRITEKSAFEKCMESNIEIPKQDFNQNDFNAYISNNSVSFDVSYTNQKGEEVISGTALVIAPRRG